MVAFAGVHVYASQSGIAFDLNQTKRQKERKRIRWNNTWNSVQPVMRGYVEEAISTVSYNATSLPYYIH